jgi:hypothetical protein
MNLQARTAIEALRAGVPNGAAVQLLGAGDTGMESAFRALLDTAGAGHGIGLAGGFGTGKSHTLTALGAVARGQRFVVSRVVISKETPLGDVGRVFEAAMRRAVLPDRNDDALAAALGALRAAPGKLEALQEAVSQPESGLAGIFAAIVFLLRQKSLPPEVARRCERFLAGGKMPSSVFRKPLVEWHASRKFNLRLPSAAELAVQRVRFVSQLFRAAGYAGWCLLFDEVELIGRYSPLQRALAYASLATWLGLDDAARFPGIGVVYAITDDFVAAVIEHRQDEDKLPERLRLKGRDVEAMRALTGIRHIRETVQTHRLAVPGTEELARDARRLREIYSAAYDWDAPELPEVERTATRTMRQYIKAWITQWDMLRVVGQAVSVVERPLSSNYEVDEALGVTEDDGKSLG